MTLRDAILEAYSNACDNGDPTARDEIDEMTPDQWALDLWWKAPNMDKWGVREITAEIIAMREEKLFG